MRVCSLGAEGVSLGGNGRHGRLEICRLEMTRTRAAKHQPNGTDPHDAAA